MTEQELDRLAALIAAALTQPAPRVSNPREPAARNEPWLRPPVRPELSTRGGEAPLWSGAAQSLEDIAPREGTREGSPARRISTSELTNVTRAAAAGRGAPLQGAGSAKSANAGQIGRPRARGAAPLQVPIGVSNRHIHLSSAHFRELFGRGEPAVHRSITQPGQFAAVERVDVIGPKGKLDAVRIVGPARGETQLEISLADSRRLGVMPPIVASGSLATSVGSVTLSGSAGQVKLARGVIVPARHLHLSAADAKRWGLRDGDRLTIRCGAGPREATFHNVLVRAGDQYATEFHLDTDEAHAAGVQSGDVANVIGWNSPAGATRPLVTERDVVALARSGGRLPDNAILTPSARDRARALRLLDA